MISFLQSVKNCRNVLMVDYISLPGPGADIGLLAGGVSDSRSHMSFYLPTGGRGRHVSFNLQKGSY